MLDVEAGSDDGCVAIVILEDEYFEDNETFSISLLDESGSELSEAIVTIVNDDASGMFYLVYPPARHPNRLILT